jgi:hypothetical protein
MIRIIYTLIGLLTFSASNAQELETLINEALITILKFKSLNYSIVLLPKK